jgi:hypothetical protein
LDGAEHGVQLIARAITDYPLAIPVSPDFQPACGTARTENPSPRSMAPPLQGRFEAIERDDILETPADMQLTAI